MIRSASGKLEIGLDLALEHEFDAERLAARLQDVEQLLAADADEAVAGGALPRALEAAARCRPSD